MKWLDDLDQGGRNNVAVVHEVVPDSPAWKAGIQANDQLEYWENTKIDSEPVWKSKVSQIKIGDVINMGIHRNHRDQRVLVRIEGTNHAQGPKRVVQSQTAIHTDN
jgi:S1-C subfamily serine protease